MQITREKYGSFIFKIIPAITLAYFVQAYFYLKYGPEGLSQEVVAILGMSLMGLFLYYSLYDQIHTVRLHRTYIEVSTVPFKEKQECLYRDVIDVEIDHGHRSFSNVILHLRSGEQLKLAHVDNAHQIRKFILERN